MSEEVIDHNLKKRQSRKWIIVRTMLQVGVFSTLVFLYLCLTDADSINKTNMVWTVLLGLLYSGPGVYAGVGKLKENNKS